MERGNTKSEILEASLELFSVNGFEAASMSQIADAVGIRKASLYSHFSSKQAILDAIVQDVLEPYKEHSIFANADWENDADKAGGQALTPDGAVQMILGQIRYIIKEPYISRARKMLVIEQFRNPELAKLQTRQNYSDVLQYFTGLMKYLIRQEVLEEDDPEIMAAQLCLPVNVWINLCDREPEREAEVMQLVEKHIRQFFKIYKPKGRK
ncbi:MAG: TetR/AcrR family transcriptional regulator [Bacillota bacterium]|nr:TetR/AcrR family transcriptional regulator [Bacillota bacterium]